MPLGILIRNKKCSRHLIWQWLERTFYDCWNEFHIGGLKRNTSEVNKKWGSGGLPPGKSSMIPPFRLLENNPFLENVPLRETKGS